MIDSDGRFEKNYRSHSRTPFGVQIWNSLTRRDYSRRHKKVTGKVIST